MPLPCENTLHNWIDKFNVLSAILNDVLKIILNKGNDLLVTENLTVLTFDKLYVCNKFERKQQKMYRPHKIC